MVRKFPPAGGRYGDRDRSQAAAGSGAGGGRDKHLGTATDDHSGGRGRRSRGASPAAAGRGRGGRGAAKTQQQDAGAIKSRREISLVTMNLSGSSLMGLTPKYKVNLIEQFLENFPEAVFIQVY